MRILFCILLLFTKLNGDTIGVIGSGYVGLVFSGMLAKWGHKVICVDIDKKKIALLNQRILPIFEPDLKELLSKNIVFTDQMNTLDSVPLLFICVGTPPDSNGFCDCSTIYKVLDNISALNQGPTVVCIKSTISPGTMRKLEDYIGSNSKFELIYNPEFMREGSAIYDLESKNPIVLGSRSSCSIEHVKKIYETFLISNPQIELIETTPETAELIKYGWNGFSAIRISYVNELSRLCTYFSADIGTLLRGISLSEDLLPTKVLKPGCGYGGSCLPKDSLGLSRTFEQSGINSTLVHQAIASNQQHLDATIHRLIEFIGEGCKRIAILGVAFKANTDGRSHFWLTLSQSGKVSRSFEPGRFYR